MRIKSSSIKYPSSLHIISFLRWILVPRLGTRNVAEDGDGSDTVTISATCFSFQIFEVYAAESLELLKTRQRLLQVRVEVQMVLPNLSQIFRGILVADIPTGFAEAELQHWRIFG